MDLRMVLLTRGCHQIFVAILTPHYVAYQHPLVFQNDIATLFAKNIGYEHDWAGPGPEP
jgi:hypothetical protein